MRRSAAELCCFNGLHLSFPFAFSLDLRVSLLSFSFPQIAEVLIRYGAQVDALSDDKSTPLHEACRTGAETTAIQLLLAGMKDAILLVLIEDGWFGLDYTVQRRNLPCFRFALFRSSFESPFACPPVFYRRAFLALLLF